MFRVDFTDENLKGNSRSILSMLISGGTHAKQTSSSISAAGDSLVIISSSAFMAVCYPRATSSLRNEYFTTVTTN